MKELEGFLVSSKGWMKSMLNKDIIIAEHGAIITKEISNPACVYHLHMHLFPIENNWNELLAQFRSCREINSLMDITWFAKEGKPYIFLWFPDGTMLIQDATNMPKQFIRRVVANMVGKECEWDWVEHPNMDNIEKYLRGAGYESI
jgi:hypothetical protein